MNGNYKQGVISILIAIMLALGMGQTWASIESIEAPPNANEPSGPGTPVALPPDAALHSPMADSDIGQTMMMVEAEPPVTTRGSGGPRLEKLFAARCRSVVFIAHRTGNGKGASISTGTGSIVSIEGHILTSAHVVEGSKLVAVGVFPSCRPGAQPEFFPAKVVKSDTIRDLALLELLKMPSDISVMPIGKLDEVRTGSAVMIIGHPRQLLMSMSQGMVSAIRPNFKWKGSSATAKRATVIQTDGSLNPGNSGGPMLSDAGHLVGVNSFIYGEASAGLNFAVSVTDVRDFLFGRSSQQAPPKASASSTPVQREANSGGDCKPKKLKEWHKDKASYTLFDFGCTGQGNAVLVIYDDKSKDSVMALDRNKDKKPDVLFLLKRDGTPKVSQWDDDYDGTYDFRGEHSNGAWVPDRKVRL